MNSMSAPQRPIKADYCLHLLKVIAHFGELGGKERLLGGKYFQVGGGTEAH